MNPSREYLCACGQTWTSRSLSATARHRCADGIRRTGHLAAGQPASEPADAPNSEPENGRPEMAPENRPPIDPSNRDAPKTGHLAGQLAIPGDVELATGPATPSDAPRKLASVTAQPTSKPKSKPKQGWPKRTLTAKASAVHTADIALAARAVAGQVTLTVEREAELIARLWANSIDTRYDALTASCPAWLNVLTTTALTIGLTVFRKAPELRRVIKLPKKPAPVDPSLGVRT